MNRLRANFNRPGFPGTIKLGEDRHVLSHCPRHNGSLWSLCSFCGMDEIGLLIVNIGLFMIKIYNIVCFLKNILFLIKRNNKGGRGSKKLTNVLFTQQTYIVITVSRYLKRLSSGRDSSGTPQSRAYVCL